MDKELSVASQVEHSIMTTYRSRLWTKFVKAIKTYNLISPNDKICVCISGGKDSFVMAKLFMQLAQISDFKFDLEYVVMNPGYSPANLKRIKDNLKLLNIPAKIIKTNIFNVATSMDKNPCYICARMRRGALYSIAKDLGCNKIALGHHYTDVIVTTLMNMLNSGSYQTMLPKLKSTNYQGMELIRPMYLIDEDDIINFCTAHDLEFLACACKLTKGIADGTVNSGNQRYLTKQLIKNLKRDSEYVEANIFKSATNVNINMVLGYKKDGIAHSFLDDYDS